MPSSPSPCSSPCLCPCPYAQLKACRSRIQSQCTDINFINHANHPCQQVAWPLEHSCTQPSSVATTKIMYHRHYRGSITVEHHHARPPLTTRNRGHNSSSMSQMAQMGMSYSNAPRQGHPWTSVGDMLAMLAKMNDCSRKVYPVGGSFLIHIFPDVTGLACAQLLPHYAQDE